MVQGRTKANHARQSKVVLPLGAKHAERGKPGADQLVNIHDQRGKNLKRGAKGTTRG